MVYENTVLNKIHLSQEKNSAKNPPRADRPLIRRKSELPHDEQKAKMLEDHRKTEIIRENIFWGIFEEYL